MSYLIEVIEYATGQPLKYIWAMTERRADKVDAGLNINLDHERFFTRVTPPDTLPRTPR
jgi:hypothetical protein